VDYISRAVDVLSSQNGVALAELLPVSGGSWGHSVASALLRSVSSASSTDLIPR
jgi:hypothetical protein